jgi:hypothetical protein
MDFYNYTVFFTPFVLMAITNEPLELETFLLIIHAVMLRLQVVYILFPLSQ